jgi:hypothetical protein
VTRGRDVKVHFGELNKLHQIMAGMGMIVDDEDYAAIVMGSLPDSYRSIISALEAATGYSSKVVTAQELITAVNVDMSIDSSIIPSLPGKAEMPHYTQETALAKGEVQRRIPSVITETKQATSNWTAGPKEAEKKGKDRQVKDGEMVAKLLPILLPLPLLCPLITTHLLPPSKLGEVAQS